jgi:ADP-ribose pyrophosphatase YjhB (NUDIX family)
MTFKKSLDFFKFCPVCGIRLDLMKMHGQPVLKCPDCNFIFFQNSKPTASAFITNSKGLLLLVKRAIQPKKNWWDMPGGFLEEGEDPLSGVKREIKEELGVKLKQIQLRGIYMDSYAHGYNMYTLNIIYTARIAAGTIKAMDDVGSTQWFDKNKIPWPRLAFPVWMRPAIRDWLKFYK